MLLILNLPLVGVFARIATIRPQVLMPVVSILCLVGTYSIRFSTFDIWVMIMAGVFGFFCRRWGFPVAPLVIGMVLGPMTENNLRLTMQLFGGQFFQITYRPVAMGFLVAAILFQLFVYRRSRKTSSARLKDRS
jgi:putative tricarboxylic transport membrane protein